MSWAALLLAAALLTGASPSRARALTAARSQSRQPTWRDASARAGGRDHPLAIASSLDVLAVCLSSGMAVSSAAAATAASAPRGLASVLWRGADLLAIGAEPGVAWSAPSGDGLDPHSLSLLRLARRSASSGAALADAVAELAVQCRNDAADSAAAAAERASVLIAGPLGLCYLPAFVCLGIAPVVAGLAHDVLGSGLL